MTKFSKTQRNRVRARANANIALAKYWGKSDVALNLPAVPSISMTLDRFTTETTVELDTKLAKDTLFLNGTSVTGNALMRVSRVLDEARSAAGISCGARVHTTNDFPTASGLASSASGFAALSMAAVAAAGLKWDAARVSRMARRASASAARSIFGGFVELPAGKAGNDRLTARPLFPRDHWDIRLVIAVVSEAAKSVGSTEAMERARNTSPLYSAWVENAPALTRQIRSALRRRDLDGLGRAMEQSTFAFHATAWTASPSIFYWTPSTLAALKTVRSLRDDRGISVWATMDAGPHVKALCLATDARRVAAALRRTEGVLSATVARPGPAAELLG